jgi:glutamate synthase domain-containing protein 3
MGGSNGSGKLAVAVVGFFAVVVGAGVTGGVTYWIDHDRTKGNERGAERIVLAEIQTDDHLVGNHSRSRLSEAAWRAERQELARSLNNVEWAWVARYYRDLAEFRARVPGERHRLEHDDKDCTLIALNAWQYSRSQQFTTLRKSGTCKKLPAAP